MKSIIIVLGVSLLWLSACAQSTEESAQDNTETAGVTCKRVSKAEFKKVLDANAELQLIDVRTPSEYNKGKIKDAKNIDFMDASFSSKINALDKSKLTLIYCQSGGRSGKALKKMKALGFTNVLELEGGYRGW